MSIEKFHKYTSQYIQLRAIKCVNMFICNHDVEPTDMDIVNWIENSQEQFDTKRDKVCKASFDVSSAGPSLSLNCPVSVILKNKFLHLIFKLSQMQYDYRYSM